MRDRPQGSVFGGYGFMRYGAAHDARPAQRRAPPSATSASAGIAAVARWLRSRWRR